MHPCTKSLLNLHLLWCWTTVELERLLNLQTVIGRGKKEDYIPNHFRPGREWMDAKLSLTSADCGWYRRVSISFPSLNGGKLHTKIPHAGMHPIRNPIFLTGDAKNNHKLLYRQTVLTRGLDIRFCENRESSAPVRRMEMTDCAITLKSRPWQNSEAGAQFNRIWNISS